MITTDYTRRFIFNVDCLSVLTRLSLGLALLMSLNLSAIAQSAAARPERGIAPANSYSVSDIESVNLTNGNLNLSIPLAALPPMSGGKLSWTTRAVYNSKMWDTVRSEIQPDPLDPYKYTVSHLQLSGVSGWRVGARYEISFQDSDWDYEWIRPASQQSDPEYNLLTQNRWTKVVLSTPDGAEHELRPTDYSPYTDFYGNHPYLRGYYKDNPSSGSVNATMRYYSYDGSHLWVRIDPDPYLFSGNARSWTLYLPDGTKVEQLTSGIQRITDTNGNKIKIWSETDGSGITTTHYQDELTLRETRYVYNPAGNGGQGQGQAQYQTVGGAWMSITVNFGATRVFGKTYWINDALCTDAADYVDETITVIRAIIFPQTEPGLPGRQFTFSYNSDTVVSQNQQWRPDCNPSYITFTTASQGWGSLNHVGMPSGATIDYTYGFDGNHALTDPDDAPRESVGTKTLTHDSTSDTWTYGNNPGAGGVTNPDGSEITETMYPYDRAFAHNYAGFGGKEGLVYRIDNSGKTRVERHWTLLNFGGDALAPGANVSVAFNPVVDAEYTSLMEGGQPVKMSARTFQYDYNGNLLEEKIYDWFDPSLVSRDAQGVPTSVPGGTTYLRRTTTNTFHNQATASNSPNVYARRALATGAPLILNAIKDTTTGPSQTQFSYDNQAYGTAPTIGNLTRISAWDDQASAWRNTTHTYNGSGNRTSTTDPNGNVTSFYYDTTPFVSPNRIVVDPQNGTGTQTTTFVYDSATGLVTSQTDPNNKTTTTDYTNQRLGAVDPFGRPGVVTGPQVDSVVNGVTYINQQRKVKSTYYDDARQVVVESDLNQTGDYKLKARTSYDQLGRAIKTEGNEDGTANYTISAQTVYLNVPGTGTVTKTANPKRNAAANTDGWTRTTRDSLGRVTEVATFLGASQPPDSGTTSNWTGSVTSSFYANQTTVTDQAGKMRRSVTDGLGRLSQVIEDPNGLNYQTNYFYDSLGNLRKVEQGEQARFFMYDSLSRLIRAKNPEQDVNANLNLTDPITSNNQWSMKYTYQANGNLFTRVDARNITTTYSYDGLNRNTLVDYSDSTPDITRTYDTATNGKGRLRKTETAGGAGSRMTINSYDAMGKPLSQSQQFFYLGAWGSSYTMQHSYNLAGGVTSQTYPSGRTTTTNYDSAGRLNTFSGNLGDGVNRNYVTGTTVYTATGQMTQEQFGTTATLYHRRHFNSRGQVYDVRLGTGAADDFSNATWNRGALRTFYSSNLVDYNNPPTGQQNNNGNVYRQDHFVPLNDAVSNWVMSVDNYSYDALNRLTSVSEAADSYLSGVFQETYPYAQYFNYDRYGNRTLGLATTGAASGPGATFIKDTVWVEDSLPTGATGFADGGDNWTWVSGNPSPVSGSSAHQSNIAAGMHQHYFTGATATMPVSAGDKLFAYVYLDPANMPSEVMLQWNENGSWEHRAYWGANSIAWGVDGTASRRNMGSLPPNGGWMRLEVPASLVGLEGKTVTGMAFTLYGGRATWDRAGKSAQPGGSINNRPFNVDTARNRLLAVSGAMQYDAAGNLNYDNYTTPLLGQRSYDAENKMTAVYNGSGVLQDSYYYDGDGRRARRIINNVETWQIYGIGGELVAEYAAGGATNAPQKEYGYRGGQLLIVAESNGTVKWLVGDHLGTPRMVVDKSGALSGANGIVRHDYLPFGEEISAGVGIRSASYGYGTDTVRQKYTGHERDDETELDFAQARYYASKQGRFTSTDSFAGSALDPQSLNLYAYSLNNPLKYSDPSGHIARLASSIIDESTRYYCCRGEGLIIANPAIVERILKFLLGDYTDDPGDASHDVSEALRGPSALLINPGTVGAQVEVGIADTNLLTEIMLGAENGLRPQDFGVPSGTQLVTTDTIIDEIASKTGIARDSIVNSARKLNIEIRNPAADKLAAAAKEVSGLFSGTLPKDPKKAGNTLTDLKIIAEAKALGVGLLSNDTGVFQSTAKGGGTLAKRLGVGFQRTTVSPRAPDFRGRLIKAVVNILK